MTTLEAVNRVFVSIGELPVEEIDETITEIALALTHIDMANKEVQLDSWYFNTEKIELQPDNNGYVYLPYDAVKVIDLPYGCIALDNKIYDEVKKTFAIKRVVKCEVVKLVEFEKLPLTFALWVTLRAAKKYQNNTLTSPALLENLQREETEAMLLAKREHRQIVRPNLKGTNVGFNIQKVLRR